MSAAADLAASNLRVATQMYETVLATLDPTHVDRFFAPTYIQHGSLVADGRDALRNFLAQAKTEFPHVRTQIKRRFADGDHVIFHVHVVLEPGTPGLAVVDIFRMEEGLVAEHWEVIQPVPTDLAHDNGSF